MKLRNKQMFDIHASYFRTLANSNRLAIMACLDVKEMSVSEIAETIEVPLPTISQHLAVLRNNHFVIARKKGVQVFYSAADPRIIEAYRLIRTVLFDGMKQRGEIEAELFSDNNIFIE